jgi:hypothetical protein
MAYRPFFKTSIDELEQKFDQESDDPKFCKLLREELQYRTTKRAERLKKRLAAIKETSQKTAEPSPLQRGLSTESIYHPEPQTTAPPSEMPSNENSKEPVKKEAVNPASIEPMPLNLSPVTSGLHNFSKPEAILSAWTAMEVLSPATFRKPETLCDGKHGNVIQFSNGVMPWQDGVKRYRKGYRLYYQVILGTILMEPAIEALHKVYTDTREQRPAARGEAVIASVMVDNEGRLAGNTPVVISSFGWGVPVALRGDLRCLEQWSQAEQQLVEALAGRLAIQGNDGNALPLTADNISDAFIWLARSLGLDDELISKPSFALCMYQWNPLPDAPDPALLNSFFLKDLAWAKQLAEKNTLPDNIKRYLGITIPETRWNLMQDHGAVRHILAPSRYPTASWPSKGRYPLALLQQCAVNIALSDLKNGGILAVNGPPGTGKTTLLRDIVAAIITERAKVLATYADPEDAFTHSGHQLKRGSAFLHMYSVDKKIRGFEIVVASSNNKAVENVSVELPGRDAVAEDSFPGGYFSTVSDALFSNNTWGIISAVLGNTANRSRFRQTFWWDKDSGMQGYLRQACGIPVSYTDANGKQCIPSIIQKENPPADHAAALVRWKQAQKIFLRALKCVNEQLTELQKIHELYDGICRRHAKIAEMRTQLPHLEGQLNSLKNSLLLAQSAFSDKQSLLNTTSAEFKDVEAKKPIFISRLFASSSYRAWLISYTKASKKLQSAQTDFSQARSHYDSIVLEKDAIEKQTKEHIEEINTLYDKLAKLQKQYAASASNHSGTFVDAAFFLMSHAERQTASPWLDAQTAKLRGDLFEAAVALHKAFVDGAAKPIRHNCSIFLENYGAKSLGSPEKDALIMDLWTTFFLIVPVVSTTFASVGNMLSGITQENLGWLLIDEAGQALPQAAVGALLRFKRAVVVGDPLQIEPIVVLPESLTEKICDSFSVDPNIYNPPGASAQTLADRSTAYIGSFETPYGTREVGVPLLVHRRCAEPMFSISNAIAYEHLMVQAKQSKSSSVVDAIGNSRWLDISGRAQGKWCPQEGDKVLQLLRAIRDSGCAPDIYLVTPFVDIQNGSRSLLLSSSILDGWVENPREWVNERVGTVHTVQGRESEAVIFVLGAPETSQRGARTWAGKTPNLLNVAVTRAKEAVYVVGCKEAWKDAGVFQTLYRMIP